MQWVVWSIHEDRLFSTVAMDVKEASNRVRLSRICQNIFAQLLDAVDCWVEFRVGGQELPVQIVTREGRPVVAGNDAIGVRHGDHSKDGTLSEVDCFGALSRDELEEALHDVRCVRFTGVDPCTNDDILFVLIERHFALVIELRRVDFKRGATGST